MATTSFCSCGRPPQPQRVRRNHTSSSPPPHNQTGDNRCGCWFWWTLMILETHTSRTTPPLGVLTSDPGSEPTIMLSEKVAVIWLKVQSCSTWTRSLRGRCGSTGAQGSNKTPNRRNRSDSPQRKLNKESQRRLFPAERTEETQRSVHGTSTGPGPAPAPDRHRPQPTRGENAGLPSTAHTAGSIQRRRRISRTIPGV